MGVVQSSVFAYVCVCDLIVHIPGTQFNIFSLFIYCVRDKWRYIFWWMAETRRSADLSLVDTLYRYAICVDIMHYPV